MDSNKAKHINLLLAENKKNSKKKRVSFSIFQAETFEEIEELRRMKESALKSFQQQKNKTNEYREMILNRNTKDNDINTSDSKSNDSGSAGRKDSNDNKSNNDISLSNTSAIINIKPIKKNDNIQDLKQIEKERKRKEALIVIQKNKEEDDILALKHKKETEEAVKRKLDEEYILKKEQEELRLKEENEQKRIIEKERITKEIEDKLRKEYDEKIRIENEERIQKEKEEKAKIAEEARLLRLKEEAEQLQIKKAQEEKNAQLCQNATILFNLIKGIFYCPYRKSFNYDQFKTNMAGYIIKKQDDYINYEITNPTFYSYVNSKTMIILSKNYLKSFLYNLREKRHQRIIYNQHNERAKKYLLYCNYKQKALIFQAMYSYSIKQRNWITSIRCELSKGLLWSCLDSMKIYTNYKKIKTYLKLQKQKRILYALSKNARQKYELERKSHSVFLIFIYKNFLSTIRKNILMKKGDECNEIISQEFHKQTLLKKVFNLIHAYYSAKKDKLKKTKKDFHIKHQNCEYIKIKISKKETIKYSNHNVITKQTSNRINIV